MDGGTYMQEVVRGVHSRNIISLAHRLHLVMRDALGLGSTAKGG